MTIKIRPIHQCAKPKCPWPATVVVTFTTHRGQINGPQVCEKHVAWGKQRAKEIEQS